MERVPLRLGSREKADEQSDIRRWRGRHAAAPSTPRRAGRGSSCAHLTKVFAGGVIAVDDVNLTIEHGEYVVLLGPSGCGKTTTLRMIGGHEEPTSGEILLDGESLVGLPAGQAADDDRVPALRALPAQERASTTSSSA